MKLSKSNFAIGLISAAVVTLTACGGGGGGSAGGTANGTVSSVTGVAATGLAIVNGSVTLKCVVGTTSSKATGTDGSFNIDVSGVTLPCVARVTYTDSAGAQQKLHSLVSTASNVNITPVTDLLVAKLTNGSAATAFDSFDASKVQNYTKDQVSTATAAVKTYLKDTLGVDTTNLPDDLIGTKLVAQTSSVSGDNFDKVLDDLKVKLNSKGKTLEGAETEVSSEHTPVTVTAGPAQTITFTSPGTQTIGTATSALVATSTSGLAITFASTTPSVCTVSGTALTLVAAGSCTVTADQAGNSVYSAATTVSYTFSVIAATSTPTPTPTPTPVVTSAATGKTVYAATCATCHSTMPALNISKVLNGANSPNTILNAISSNKGGMKVLSISTQQASDIAAYLATPNI
jgi:mono/diheme cytochrome c family protein